MFKLVDVPQFLLSSLEAKRTGRYVSMRTNLIVPTFPGLLFTFRKRKVVGDYDYFNLVILLSSENEKIIEKFPNFKYGMQHSELSRRVGFNETDKTITIRMKVIQSDKEKQKLYLLLYETLLHQYLQLSESNIIENHYE